jgi:hypothetical protein
MVVAHVVHDRPDPNETQSGRILQFRLRRRIGGGGGQAFRHSSAVPAAAHDADPVDDLAQYEEEDRNIDYRHRMRMNVIAVAIVSILVGAGVWLADTIADMEKAQDCALQGRQNCAPIEMPVKK